MRRPVRIALGVALLVQAAAVVLAASPVPPPPRVYLRNRPVASAVLVQGLPCLPPGVLIAVLGCPLEVQGDGTILMRGHRLPCKARRLAQAWLVALQEVAPHLGLVYRYDPTLAMVDLYRPDATRDIVRPINLRAPGQELDLRPYIVAGRETLFFLASDRVEACRQVDQLLRQVLQRRPGLVVRRLEVCRSEVEGMDWESPLMKQWGARSLPWFVLYDEHGVLTQRGEDAAQQLRAWLAVPAAGVPKVPLAPTVPERKVVPTP